MLNITAGLMLKTILFVIQNDSVINNEVDNTTDRCYGTYGCFPISPPWTSHSRPVALYPLAPDVMKVRFPMFTRKNINIPYFLEPNDLSTISDANLNEKGPFYIISHGYLESGNKLWIQKMTEALLLLEENADATVISVDWRGGSNPPYTQAVANIRLVGTITAHLIHDIYLHLNLENLDNFHFIGHSLGAHCAGYAGSTLINHFGLTLGRISGLDPAEPHFGKTDDVVRLDKNDAKFVDIIHTDANPFISGGLGISETIGHVDFFPNGGSDQPGCNRGMLHYLNNKQGGSIFKSIQKFFNCNHVRSYEYYIESILSSCPYMATECSTYQDFAKGSCFKCGENGRQCIPFGFHSQAGYDNLVQRKLISPTKPLKAYLMTNDEHPFCRIHYRVTVNISASMESSSHGGDVGKLWMTLVAKDGWRSERVALEEHAGYHKPGTQETFMVAMKDGAIPDSALFEWEFETNLLNPLTWRFLMSPRVYISWVHIESLEYKTSITVCPEEDKPVIANTPSHFQRNMCKNIFPIKISTSSTNNLI